MSAFDQIIGYKIIRKELERTADALKNSEVYRALGVSTPRGLLLHGEPGVGKSLMASCLIEESGRSVLTLRRDKPDGDFVRAIKDTFEKAAAHTPSIVFLDDMDKFAKAEEHCSNQEEFVAVQAAIDSVKDKDIFVLATANDLYVLPDSLIRAGRFDRVIEVECPNETDAPEIVAHFLAGKPLAEDVDAKTVARLLSGRSCAELETAVNAAGMLAAYERCAEIEMRHVVMGCVSTIHGVTADHVVTDRPDDPHDADSVFARVACHEAGHAVVAEALEPGSVALACIHELQDGSRGVTVYARADCGYADQCLDRVVQTVAGHVATELFFGISDTGASRDVKKAQCELRRLFSDDLFGGSSLLSSFGPESNELLARQELAVAMELDRCIGRARRILAENRVFLEAMTAALLKKGLLTGEDVREIRRGSTRECA